MRQLPPQVDQSLQALFDQLQQLQQSLETLPQPQQWEAFAICQRLEQQLLDLQGNLQQPASILAPEFTCIYQAVESTTDAIAITNLQGEYLYLNPAYIEQLGYTVEQLNHLGGFQQLYPVSAQAEAIRRAMTRGENWYGEVVMRSRQGKQLDVWLRIDGIRNSTGEVTASVGIFTNITIRKQAKVELAQRERYLAALVEVEHSLLSTALDADDYETILAPLGAASAASRIYVFENHWDGQGRLLMSQKCEWCADGIQPEIHNPQLQNLSYDQFFPRWFSSLSQGKPIAGNVAQFPQSEQEILEPQGILSILILPIMVRGQFFGFIGFDNCAEARPWTSAEISLLETAAVAIALSKERQHIAQALQDSQRRFQAIFNNTFQFTGLLTPAGTIVETNQTALDFAGLSNEDVQGKPFGETHWWDSSPQTQQALRGAISSAAQGQFIRYEADIYGKDGKRVTIDFSLKPIFDDQGKVELLVSEGRDITALKQAQQELQDLNQQLEIKVNERTNELRKIVLALEKEITERTQAEAKLKASLQEKEVLLKEVHHRVKNNLQIVSSLLKLQSSYLDNPDVLVPLNDSYDRVRSMALIHEKLYQSEDLARIEASDYIQNLANNLFASYRILPDDITLITEVEGVLLDVDTAIPCGLIINELLTNSIKYAFPTLTGSREESDPQGEQRNEILIQFYCQANNRLVLRLQDNGTGLPPDFRIRETESLGLQLVYNLTQQLEGDLEIDTEAGTTFTITLTSQACSPDD